MSYSIQQIQSFINASATIHVASVIEHLVIDSRRITFPNTSLFFALHSNRRDGHSFIQDVYDKGVRNFIVSSEIDTSSFPDANFLVVINTLQALQLLVTHHRKQFTYSVIGITGSNGKTIVKEWLYQLLQSDYTVVRSPRSYNSQIGVPLSVWQMNAKHTLGIFEAGISTINEMENLQKIISPTVGVLTNIGEAHNEGFANDAEKLKEKLLLFQHAKKLVYCKDVVDEKLLSSSIEKISWSKEQDAVIQIDKIIKASNNTLLSIIYQKNTHEITIPFTDDASIENCITCICTLLALNINITTIVQRVQLLQALEMRLQLKKGINNCSIINDSYSNDVSSLGIALDFLKQQSGNVATTVILSDILESGTDNENLYQQVAAQLQQRNINQFIGIGVELTRHQHLFTDAVAQISFYTTTQIFLQNIHQHQFKDEFILLKGARVFAFENISKWLEQKVHETIMEINLSAMAHNLKEYQKKLLPTTKLMAMVKAFSYGSGSAEVARLLQFHKVDYLAVAYIDEGVELRKANINLPILVLNIDTSNFDLLIEHNLEPEIYSFTIYNALHQYLLQQGITQLPVHIKLNTGMNRLGFDVNEVETIAELLHENNTMFVKSVFSHLTSSEAVEHKDFTLKQSNDFINACTIIEKKIGYSFIKHIANTAAIFHYPQLQYDMVRLGIGLYGVDSSNAINLQTVATLKSTIAQIRTVKANDTVGYNKMGKLTRDSKIATIRIGYADGYSRKLSNGIGSMYVKGSLAKVVGNVCMDMVMIDITDIENVQEGDEVEIFGSHISVQQIAQWCSTISYEILTSVSQRVKRVYVEE